MVNSTIQKTNPDRLARITGFLYFLMIPLGIFSIMYVPKKIFIEGDGATTMHNINLYGNLFKQGIFSAVMLQIINIFVAIFLYRLLKPVNQKHARLLVLLFIISVPITLLNELNHLAVLLLSSGKAYFSIFSSEQLQSFIFMFNDLHKYGIKITSIFWGLWLFPMGYLIYQSSFLPRFLGILLIIGCFGYLVDFISYFIFPDLKIPTISIYTSLGELILPFWLMFAGVNTQRWLEVNSLS